MHLQEVQVVNEADGLALHVKLEVPLSLSFQVDELILVVIHWLIRMHSQLLLLDRLLSFGKCSGAIDVLIERLLALVIKDNLLRCKVVRLFERIDEAFDLLVGFRDHGPIWRSQSVVTNQLTLRIVSYVYHCLYYQFIFLK